MRVCVIVTTYNRPDALAAVLHGYLAQSDSDFELIVADDGSTSETAELVRSLAVRAPMPVRHVWHEDRGFRAAEIRNRALAASAAEYAIFTDGDCVPSRVFVAQHRRLAEPGWFVSGNRVLLSQAFTARVLERRTAVEDYSWAQWVRAHGRGDVNRIAPLIRLPDGAWRKRHAREWRGVKTCNLSAWRTDLERVNGLDETYSGWGLEDTDLVVRLLHAGVRHKSARFAAPVFHLWHRENDRCRLPENQRRLDDLLRSQRVRAELGLDRHTAGNVHA